ncbi:MAG: 16S rRNA (adenine(1518)-N(6)/adenine(1519)-N(6))-dimethyltransferase RsmA [Actinomycetota bacterium]|nr:16S rRNA (adenine(1518)-N(6)/adenine(1519)-N(6))-dimethyltransferase RsmA [Actinomycetota bacterium]
MSERGLTKGDILDLLGVDSLSPKRSLGQNFLVDSSFARKVATACVGDEAGTIVEIGPGFGSLTLHLASMVKCVFAIEKDNSVASRLQEICVDRSIDNVTVFNEDALEVDYALRMGELGAKVVVGNLPYNISVPLILKIISESSGAVDRAAFMVQKEVAERLSTEPGGRNSSFTSLKRAFYASSRILFDVPPTVFFPEPNVTSAIVEFRSDRTRAGFTNEKETEIALALAKIAFGNRRQMLRRTLKPFFQVLDEAGVDPTMRPEALKLSDWLSIGVAALKGGIDLSTLAHDSSIDL